MDRYSWEDNQEVILLGVMKAGKHMINNADQQKRLTSQQSNKLQIIGKEIIRKFKNCQESHLEEPFNFLIDF